MTREEAVALLERYSNYDGIGIPNLIGCKEAMKIAADILSQSSLPANLDEAARKYGHEKPILPEGYNDGDIPLYQRWTADAFKDGAEWMAGRGFISEGIINQSSDENTLIELNENIGYLEDCEEVIVQIRKKQ